MCLFRNIIINKLEGLLDAKFTKKGRIKYYFYTMSLINIIFIEVKKNLVISKGKLNIIG